MSASSELTVVLARHLHARPAGQVAQAAARYPDTTIELLAGDRSADARSILAVMGLGAVAGSEVRVRAAGGQAAGAAATVVAILTTEE
jgi:phosphocarrier protein HPr